jgi:hypothetical protein
MSGEMVFIANIVWVSDFRQAFRSPICPGRAPTAGTPSMSSPISVVVIGAGTNKYFSLFTLRLTRVRRRDRADHRGQAPGARRLPGDDRRGHAPQRREIDTVYKPLGGE